jgi:hypothetical protein
MFHVKHLRLDQLYVSRETSFSLEKQFAESKSGIQAPAVRSPSALFQPE